MKERNNLRGKSCNIVSLHIKCINREKMQHQNQNSINNKTIMDVRILHFQKCTDLGSLSPRHYCCNENNVAK